MFERVEGGIGPVNGVPEPRRNGCRSRGSDRRNFKSPGQVQYMRQGRLPFALSPRRKTSVQHFRVCLTGKHALTTGSTVDGA